MTRSHILLALAARRSTNAQCLDFNPERNHYVGDYARVLQFTCSRLQLR